MTRIRAVLAASVCVAGFGFASVGLPASVRYLEQVQTYELDDRWAGGAYAGVDIKFLRWVAARVGNRDKFVVINRDGNPAVDQWPAFQLYPATMTENLDEADWAILFGATPRDSGLPLNRFDEVQTYSKSLHLLERRISDLGNADSDGG